LPEGITPEAFIQQLDRQNISTAVESTGENDAVRGGLYDIRKTLGEFTQARTSGEKDLAACRLSYHLYEMWRIRKGLTVEQQRSLGQNEIFSQLDLLRTTVQGFLTRNGGIDEIVCAEAMAEAPICMPNGQ